MVKTTTTTAGFYFNIKKKKKINKHSLPSKPQYYYRELACVYVVSGFGHWSRIFFFSFWLCVIEGEREPTLTG